MHKRLNIKLILIETAFIFFFVTALLRLYIANQTEIIDAILHKDELYDSLTNLSLGELMTEQIFFPYKSFAIAVLIIGLINWRLKQAILNTVLVSVFSYLIFPLKLIHGGQIPQIINSFCYLFSNDRKYAFLIGGSVFGAVALFLLWLTIVVGRKKKRASL